MSTINLTNGRLHSDIRAHVSLKDNGVSVDWSGLTDIRAYLWSVPQNAIAGKFTVAINPSDNTDLVCDYSADDPQYEGITRIIVRCVYEGRTKTYDAALVNLVPSTDDLADDPVVIDDPEVPVEIQVTEVSTSLLDEAIQAALDAAEEAEDAADLAEAKAALANTKAELAQAAAALANTKAALANTKAALADTAAQAAQAAAELANAKAALANTKAELAQTAADLANEKAALANTKAGLAQTAADLANEKAALANTKAGLAQTAADLANEKAALANTKAVYADEQGDYAKQQGDYAKGQIDGAKGSFPSLNDRFEATEQAAITIDETTDPADAEYQDEYQRILAVLYQALVDAKAAIGETESATEDVRSAKEQALDAAMEALRKAGLAEEAARTAMQAAEAAEAAKGNYGSLDERLAAIEIGKQDVVEDLDEIRTGAAAGRTAYQKPGAGVPSTDLAEDVQTALGKAGTAVQPEGISRPAVTGSYNDLTDKPANLSEFTNNVAVTFEENVDPSSIIE